MMEYKEQLELQAYLDGELPEAAARAMTERAAREPELGALLGELRQTREALTGGELERPLPETREFYWSKIQRQIERELPVRERAAEPFAARLRRFLLPASGVAVVTALGLMAARWQGGDIADTETALDDSGAFTYHDNTAGATLVWVSYPAEEELAQDDEMGTAQ